MFPRPFGPRSLTKNLERFWHYHVSINTLCWKSKRASLIPLTGKSLRWGEARRRTKFSQQKRDFIKPTTTHKNYSKETENMNLLTWAILSNKNSEIFFCLFVEWFSWFLISKQKSCACRKPFPIYQVNSGKFIHNIFVSDQKLGKIFDK